MLARMDVCPVCEENEISGDNILCGLCNEYADAKCVAPFDLITTVRIASGMLMIGGLVVVAVVAGMVAWLVVVVVVMMVVVVGGDGGGGDGGGFLLKGKTTARRTRSKRR